MLLLFFGMYLYEAKKLRSEIYCQVEKEEMEINSQEIKNKEKHSIHFFPNEVT